MKIKIEEHGWLEIERAGRFKKQCCPFDTDNYCGDWCPLFHEPTGTKGEGYITLELCQTFFTLDFDEFTDERAQAK